MWRENKEREKRRESLFVFRFFLLNNNNLFKKKTKTKKNSTHSWTPPFPAYPSGHTGFGSAAFQLVRLFYGVPAGAAGHGPDAVFEGDFVSGEYDGATFDNAGVVRPLVLRGYKGGGLWKAILENAQSRVFLGVHWWVVFFLKSEPFFLFLFSPRSRCDEYPVGEKQKKKLIFFFLSLSPFLQKKHKRTYDSFYPKDGNPLVPDLSKNVGSMPLGLPVAEDIFSAGGGLAPKFVGSPVPLPPPPSASSAATPALSPAEVIEGGLSGVTRAPRSRGVDYEPEPGLGEVSDMFVRPRRK